MYIQILTILSSSSSVGRNDSMVAIILLHMGPIFNCQNQSFQQQIDEKCHWVPMEEAEDQDMSPNRIYKAYTTPWYLNTRHIITAIVVVASLALITKIAIFPGVDLFGYSQNDIPYLSSVLGRAPHTIKAATWNIAAINNNPFEYWITPTNPDGTVRDDPVYNGLMKNISSFIESPGDYDIKVGDLFTDAMYDKLETAMTAVGWQGVNVTRSMWDKDYKNRKIISEYILDPIIGKKRLASMPDRVTNTINTRSEKEPVATRPTVINCYDGDLGTIEKWWDQWIYFMFKKEIPVERQGKDVNVRPYEMLVPIKKSKYPTITTEEEAVSIPLQTLCCAIFDAILVHMMNKLALTTWQPLRQDMCNKLNRHKTDRTMEILETTYNDQDIIFLQEVAGAFARAVQSKPLINYYDVYYPKVMDDDRDQNSFILLKKGKYTDIKEVTENVLDEIKGTSAPIAKGDLLAMTVVDNTDNKKYLLGSFHGDTNGLATIPIVTAMHSYASMKLPDHHLLFGMDANTYSKPEADQQGVVEFGEQIVNLLKLLLYSTSTRKTHCFIVVQFRKFFLV